MTPKPSTIEFLEQRIAQLEACVLPAKTVVKKESSSKEFALKAMAQIDKKLHQRFSKK